MSPERSTFSICHVGGELHLAALLQRLVREGGGDGALDEMARGDLQRLAKAAGRLGAEALRVAAILLDFTFMCIYALYMHI